MRLARCTLGVLVRSLGCLALVVLSTAVLVGQALRTRTRPETHVPQHGKSVALNVSVFDKQARYVTGLKPSDFAVFEDGVQQNVEFFETNAVPVDLIVLIDASSSMSDKLDAIHEAAVGFLSTLARGGPRRGRDLQRQREGARAVDDRSRCPRARGPLDAGEGLDRAEHRALHLAQAVRSARSTQRRASAVRRSPFSPTATTPPAWSRSTTCWRWRAGRV